MKVRHLIIEKEQLDDTVKPVFKLRKEEDLKPGEAEGLNSAEAASLNLASSAGLKSDKAEDSFPGKTVNIRTGKSASVKQGKPEALNLQLFLLIGLLGAAWFYGGAVLQIFDVTAGSVDPSIWLLVLLSLICFVLILGLSWWIFKSVWKSLGFPLLSTMVSQFNNLSAWQQLSFFWASFALVLLAAIGSLSAVL